MRHGRGICKQTDGGSNTISLMETQNINTITATNNLKQLQINRATNLPSGHLGSGSTSATTSLPPSTARSLASCDTPETSDDDTLELPPSFAIHQTRHRGLALLTRRRIPAGTLIFSEAPLISLSKDLENDYDAIQAAFKSLSKPDRKAYLKLYDAEKSRMSQVVSIYYANCYNKDSFVDEGGSCVSLLASRINHSCAPNATFSYLPHSASHPKGLVQFHAIKSIPADREIVSCYEKNIFLTKEERQRRLLLDYGFRCDCEACMPETAFWEKSDERRKVMGQCVKATKKYERDWEGLKRRSGTAVELEQLFKKAIDALVRLEGLLIKEGMLYTPLANTYRSLGKWGERIGDSEEVSKWKRKELGVCVTCFGGDATRCKGLKDALRMLGHD